MPEFEYLMRVLVNGFQVHLACAECLLELTNKFREAPPAQWTEPEFMSELVELSQIEKNEQAKSLLKKCIQLLKDDVKLSP